MINCCEAISTPTVLRQEKSLPSCLKRVVTKITSRPIAIFENVVSIETTKLEKEIKKYEFF